MKLYCLGDSLTFGYGMAPSKRWLQLAGRESGWELRNFGVCGDTTSGMLVRLHTQLKPELKPGDHVLVMGGSNDIFYSGSSEAARSNLGAMTQQLLAWGVKPIVGIPLPVCPGDIPTKWAALTDMEQAAKLLAEYRDWLHRFCYAFGVDFVDFYGDFMADRSLFLDGMHPSEAGHRLMAERLVGLLRALEAET